MFLIDRSYWMDKDFNITLVQSHLDEIENDPQKFGLSKTNASVDLAIKQGFIRVFGSMDNWALDFNGNWGRGYRAAIKLSDDFGIKDNEMFILSNKDDKRTKTLSLGQIRNAIDTGAVASKKQ